jgi:aminoglycoside 2'-N-acetyltransferase I
VTVTLRRVPTDGLRDDELRTIREMLITAFGTDPEERLRDEDWEHALGGIHVLAEDDGVIVAHAAVVERLIEIGGRPIRTGYVEAVATLHARRGTGLGTLVMEEVARIIRDGYELGMLGTGVQSFYERLGWRIWRGPSAVRTADGEVASPDEDGYLMVFTTDATRPLDPAARITCDDRPGDAW